MNTVLTFLLLAAVPPQEPADLILVDGDVYTVDAARPRARAVAVRGERILALGSSDEVRALAGPETRVIDLGGRLVLPGFVDNHVHFASAARFLEFNIMRVDDQREFRRRVADVVARLEDGEWILGGLWGAYDAWAAGSSGGQSRARFTPELSAVADLLEQHPLMIQRFDGRELLVNGQALAAAGIDLDDPPQGVELVTDESGRFTGLVRGPRAGVLLRRAAPREVSHARRLAQTRHALEEVRRRGVTTVSDMSDDEQLAIYRELLDAGELTVRVHFRYALERWKELADQGIRGDAHGADDWIRLGSLKGHIDGIMGSSSARFLEPYSNDPTNRGRWRRLMVDEEGELVEGKFLKYMLDADAAGLQVTVHAIGDEANHVLLDYLEELRRVNGERDRRFRLVHAQVIADADFQRLGELDVIAEVQPFHLSDDMRWMEERIGTERCAGAYAFRRIAESGALLCFGTDWPGTGASEYPIDPLLGIYAALTRRTVSGQPQQGWFPDQRIGVEQAIRAYTLHSAYANFEEQAKGSITPGKLADLVVLSRNLLTIEPAELLSTEVDLTIVGGTIVHERVP